MSIIYKLEGPTDVRSLDHLACVQYREVTMSSSTRETNQQPPALALISRVNFIARRYEIQQRDDTFITRNRSSTQPSTSHASGSQNVTPLDSNPQLYGATSGESPEEGNRDYFSLDVSEGGRRDITYSLQVSCETTTEEVRGRQLQISRPLPTPAGDMSSLSVVIPLRGILGPCDDLVREVIFPPRRSRSRRNSYAIHDFETGEPYSLDITLTWFSRSGRSTVFDSSRISYEIQGVDNGDGTFSSVVFFFTIFNEVYDHSYASSLAHSGRMSRAIVGLPLQAIRERQERNPRSVGEVMFHSNGSYQVLLDNRFGPSIDGTLDRRIRFVGGSPEESAVLYQETPLGNSQPMPQSPSELEPGGSFHYRVRGAASQEMLQFPAYRVTPAMIGKICPVCQCEFLESEEVRKLPCTRVQHEFHKECIDKWMALTFTCPVDRTDFSTRS